MKNMSKTQTICYLALGVALYFVLGATVWRRGYQGDLRGIVR